MSCSSSSTSDAGAARTAGSSTAHQPSDSPEPTQTADRAAPADGGGTITFTGAQSGSVDFDSAVCAVLDGDFEAVIAPDDQVDPEPKATLTANHGQGQWTTAFLPSKSDAEHAYVRNGADGMSAAEHNGVWTVTLSNTQLGLVTNPGTVTLNGTLTCSRTTGT